MSRRNRGLCWSFVNKRSPSEPYLDATVLVAAQFMFVASNGKCRAVSAHFDQICVLRILQLPEQCRSDSIRTFERERYIFLDCSNGVGESNEQQLFLRPCLQAESKEFGENVH